MKHTVNNILNTATVIKAVLKSEEFDTALDIASKKLRALRKTEKREYESFYAHIEQEKRLMDKYYTQQRKTICRAFFAQLKAIYAEKEQQVKNLVLAREAL